MSTVSEKPLIASHRMSSTSTRRSSAFSGPSNSSEQPALRLQFQWSATAANSSIISDNAESFVSSSPDIDRYPRKPLTSSSSSINLTSINQLSISPRRSSFLPHIVKKRDSVISLSPSLSPLPLPVQEPTCHFHSPISISYTELHVLPSPTPSPVKKSKTQSTLPLVNDKRRSISIQSEFDHNQNNGSTSPTIVDKRKSLSVSPPLDERRRNLPVYSVTTEKRASPSTLHHSTSTKLHKTATAVTTIPILKRKSRNQSAQQQPQLVRLGTPQLIKLQVSEKYFHEAKKLYYNAPCRSFVPRVAIV